LAPPAASHVSMAVRTWSRSIEFSSDTTSG
jgi:hypothetical protein